ncbi:MAG: histidine kinase [Dehalococcoidales bacterium]|nr:histidine kinase [Dehalococcoidales bacterium]
MEALRWIKFKPRLSITYKILVYFLALLLFSLVLTGYFTNRTVDEIGRVAKENNSYLALNITDSSINALELVGKNAVINQAGEVANQVKNYLDSYYDSKLDVETLKQDVFLARIASQSFGSTGITTVYLERQLSVTDSIVALFDVVPVSEGITIQDFRDLNLSWISMAIIDGNFTGYYQWEMPDGNIVSKFISIVTLDGNGYLGPVSDEYFILDTDGRLLIVATMNTEELLSPAKAMQSDIDWASMQVQSEIARQHEQMQIFNIGILALIILISCIIAFLLSKTITKPVIALTESARVIARGNFNQRVNIKTGDELDELADQFNKMAVSLDSFYNDLESKVIEKTRIEQRRSEQLRTVNEIGRQISSILSIDKLLPYVIKSLSNNFHYHNVRIYAVDPENGEIRQQAGTGQDTVVFPVDATIENIPRLAFRAYQAGKPVSVRDFSLEKSCRPESAEIRSAVAVPIVMGKSKLGVIEVHSVEANAFDDIDLFTIQTLADQIAVAITNVHLYHETRDLAVVEERNRLAREIHDTLTQGFAGIVLQLEAAEQSLYDDIKQAQVHLDRARSLARENLNEARRSVWDLHPRTSPQNPVIEDLRKIITDFIRNTGIRVNFNVSDGQRPLSSEISGALVRICKEALTNVAKYSKAQKVNIKLIFTNNKIELSISDDGIGFDTGQTKSDAFGLISMRERSQVLGGEFIVHSEKGHGTTVMASIPIKGGRSNGKN